MTTTTQNSDAPRQKLVQQAAQENPLASLLHRHRTAAILKEAAIVRDWPAGPDRTDQATRLIREAMQLRTFGKLSQSEWKEITSLLAFVMPAIAYSGP